MSDERDAEIERLKSKIKALELLNRMTDDELVLALKAEIVRLETQHEEMLLKHAREQDMSK